MFRIERRVRETREWFGPGGYLARALPGYEARAAQQDLAADVHRSLLEGGALLAEAPTGVGKSLAYLVPALLWAEREREPAVVSTYTKSLQSQILRDDVPLLAAAAGRTPGVAVLKGKANYLCARRYRLATAESKSSRGAAGALERAFAEWARESESGDLDDFPWSEHRNASALRQRVAADPSFCGPGACRAGGDCAFRRARKAAASAEIVVVNHALLVAGQAAGGVLPPFRALIVDEAQHLENAITSQLTTRLTLARIERAVASWDGARPGRGGVLHAVDTGLWAAAGERERGEIAAIAAALHTARAPLLAAAKRFFARIALPAVGASGYAPRRRVRALEEIVDGDFDVLDALAVPAKDAEERLASILRGLGRLEPTPEIEDTASDVAGVLEEWRAITRDLERLADPRGRDSVFWRAGATAEDAELGAAPVEVADAVQRWVTAELSSLVLLSATLKVGEGFDFVRARLGLGDSSAMVVRTAEYPSPFEWPRQVRALVLAEGEPTPESVSQLVAALYAAVPRNTLVLFTSHAALRRARALLADRLPRETPLWAQEVDGEAAVLRERFKRARGAVLLGTSSFWEGVDFPGAALEVLVLAKLPFAVPDDPLVEARCERVEEAGGSGFRDVQLPEAVLRFRQGVGRLVRRAGDRGVVVLADGRAVSRGYGAMFRDALPVPLERARDAGEIVRRAVEFFAAEAADEARAAGGAVRPADAV